MQKRILVFAAALFAALSLSQCTKSAPKPAARIARVWRGEVPLAKADEYDVYLRQEGVSALRRSRGNLGVQMFRRTVGDREEFTVISYWPDEDTIRTWAGSDILRARSMPRDPEFLVNPDPHVRHYRIVVDR
ncbi:MAG TPA: antibiotic biosynthesis monooxygenase [Thermoanaerobaculia bacterium]|nr:antibiotic biosynthesis monooxygenase [Thermoanaerobaculia bacterium]